MTAVEIGFAVKLADGEIDVRTVSPTKRATQVNGFAAIAGLLVAGNVPDAMINDAWEDFARQQRLSIVIVEIREKARADG